MNHLFLRIFASIKSFLFQNAPVVLFFKFIASRNAAQTDCSAGEELTKSPSNLFYKEEKTAKLKTLDSVCNRVRSQTDGAQVDDIREKEAIDSLDTQGLEADIRKSRPFSLAETIGKEGRDFLQSDAAIPRPVRATNAVAHFIQRHMEEPKGAVSTTLMHWAIHDIRLSQQLETPLVALAQVTDSVLNGEITFGEFARQVAIAESQLTGDKPYFQLPGHPPHPSATHTLTSIRLKLEQLQQQLCEQGYTAYPSAGRVDLKI